MRHCAASRPRVVRQRGQRQPVGFHRHRRGRQHGGAAGNRGRGIGAKHLGLRRVRRRRGRALSIPGSFRSQGLLAGAREALRWYLKAAEQGHVGAQYNLGAAYYLGYGVPQNYVEAHKWFSIANVTGLERAIVNRDIMTKLMTSDQIAEAQDLKRDWMARHQTR